MQICSPGIGVILCTIQGILDAVVPIILALGIVYFVWGVVMYVIANDEEAKKTGKDRIVFGIIGFAVIISLWGLVYVLANTFRVSGLGAPNRQYLNGLLPH